MIEVGGDLAGILTIAAAAKRTRPAPTACDFAAGSVRHCAYE
jgi:hypothetical protein